MNYGKFFRLNQNISKIEDGVAIYDYIDLPAYFESSGSNKMSPKYPISVTITDTIVRFRIHYSTYKIEARSNIGNHTDYQYDVEKAYNKENQSQTTLTSLKHKEQVVFELPYASDSTDQLYQAIKEIYSTRYPLIEKMGNDKSSTKQTFINALIQKRYKKGWEGGYKNDLEKQMYEKLQDSLDGDFSYSTLWLMDIVECDDNGNKNIYLHGKGSQKNIVKFLRKLLLDFMFDLKHSDVFQTNKYYDSMISGLMSNFYFSALMHKCEYYFYRGMITDIINNKRISTPEKEIEHIGKLYAKQLVDAETLWIHDIMSTSAEKYFEHFYTIHGDSSKQGDKDGGNNHSFLFEIGKEIEEDKKRYTFRSWDSWFASPEEEMRRVCFTMKGIKINDDGSVCDDGNEYICNAEVLAEFLESGKGGGLDDRLIFKKNKNKTDVSRWFLRRYSISDVFHLHLFKGLRLPFFVTTCIFLSCLFVFPDFLSPSFWSQCSFAPIILLVLYIWLWFVWEMAKFEEIKNKVHPIRRLSEARQRLVARKIKAFFITILFSLVVLAGVSPIVYWMFDAMSEVGPEGTILKIGALILQVILIALGGYYIFKKYYPVHWLSNMHVFFPRLIASIAAAWLSLAVGNELFGSFFDSIVSWSTSIWLSVIVFVFVMYEINKMLPLETTYSKIGRCFGVMAIGYIISLVVGLYIINFTGERILERSGNLKDFYKYYVHNSYNTKQVENKLYSFATDKDYNKSGNNIVHNIEETDDKLLLDELQHIHIIDAKHSKNIEPNHPIVTVWPISGSAKFFILRDFLIQFAFVAMFIGIFITMLFEEKSITES